MPIEPTRPEWWVEEPAEGFGEPWPLVYELCDVLPSGSWTLVGGLMVQLHAHCTGIHPQRATTDVDLLLHVEIGMTWSNAKSALLPAGFQQQKSLYRNAAAHRFVRVRAEGGEHEVVDVMIADHVPPCAGAEHPR
ncbi:hypothetical protein [Kocuria sp.]|uniref:hypothetical protein n=1 Tax=Kocuria sp. TaxID=1871328 RepID=UPI0026E0D754|nr:hypothetical protein [Kocuria sp.]MDO5619137.1 hypothetical protein [Kocuria sp.]